jgi:hypothetical protein
MQDPHEHWRRQGDHPACGLALSALHAELSRGRGTPRRARARHLLRNRPVLGAEIRTGDRATATPPPSAAEQSPAPRRDGGADRRRADVSVACRRSRGRGPRYVSSASARHWAPLRLMRKLLKKQGFAPKLLVTDKLRSYACAYRRLRLTCPHEQGLRQNNRAENSHQPVRRRYVSGFFLASR